MILRNQPVGFEHGTLVSVEDLFYNVPARLKFLKSAQTEFFYCYNYFVDVALWHFDKAWILKKNDKVSFDLQPTRDLKERIVDLYKKDWRKNLKDFSVDYEYVTLKGVVSDASLRFGSMENIKIYVNGRPVQDKIIRKALMDAYNRQLTPGEYPFVVLMLDIDPKMVDVNVHPAKLQVKFADSKMIYQVVYDTISASL
ncbi:MAG: DNA mismatch repair endonuclease MutL [Candidatus Peribacteria bacterium]|nr:DNA mismatch repair endonuclease MutL [Candidatus Peribacteria bacterium]